MTHISFEKEIPEGYKARIEGNKVIFELKESEDERIRKELLDWMKGGNAYDWLDNKDRWIAYLERQKEQNLEDIEDKAVRKYMKLDKFALANMLAERDKTNAEVIEAFKSIKEQPTDNSAYPLSLEEAVRLYYDTYGNGKGGFDHISLPKFQDIVETFVKDYGQKPAEWSEEDKAAFGDLMWCIEQARKSAKDENDMGNIWYAEHWLKNRIKSLRPQPHWKPSEEQLNALQHVKEFCCLMYQYRVAIETLLKQLESL